MLGSHASSKNSGINLHGQRDLFCAVVVMSCASSDTLCTSTWISTWNFRANLTFGFQRPMLHMLTMTGRAPDRPVDSLSSSLFAFKNIMFRIFQLWTILLSAMVNAQSDCRLWLAPSSVSTEDAPKLGLFAGVNYSAGDVVGQPELAIPLIDFVDEWNRRNELDEMIMSFLEGFMWTTDYAGAKWESRHGTVMFIPGHGVLANYHSGDYNVDWSQSSVLLRTPPAVPEAGKAHPSRGAITPYFNLTITATQPIQAGMELFANFGEVWDGNGTDVYQDKLVRSDYKEADKLVDALLDFMEQYRDEMTPNGF